MIHEESFSLYLDLLRNIPNWGTLMYMSLASIPVVTTLMCMRGISLLFCRNLCKGVLFNWPLRVSCICRGWTRTRFHQNLQCMNHSKTEWVDESSSNRLSYQTGGLRRFLMVRFGPEKLDRQCANPPALELFLNLYNT